MKISLMPCSAALAPSQPLGRRRQAQPEAAHPLQGAASGREVSLGLLLSAAVGLGGVLPGSRAASVGRPPKPSEARSPPSCRSRAAALRNRQLETPFRFPPSLRRGRANHHPCAQLFQPQVETAWGGRAHLQSEAIFCHHFCSRYNHRGGDF